MESDDGEELDKTNISQNSGNNIDDDFSLSITPPCINSKENEVVNNESDSISEHLSLQGSSIENDRSLPEIDVVNNNSFSYMENLPLIEGIKPFHEKNPQSLNSSFHSDTSSIISLNALTQFAENNLLNCEVKSILEEILNSDQFISENSQLTNEESLDIFVNLDLDDKGLTERILEKPNVDLFSNNKNKCSNEPEVNNAIKDDLVAFLASELDSLREVVSNPSTLSMGTSTEYKPVHEDYQVKFLEYHKALEQKDNLILELTESLQQSIQEREEMKAQVQQYESELKNLQERLEDTSNAVSNEIIVKGVKEIDLINKLKEVENVSFLDEDQRYDDFETDFLNLQKTLNAKQNILLSNLKSSIAKHIQDKIFESKVENEEMFDSLKKSIKDERNHYNHEIERLKGALSEYEKNFQEVSTLKKDMEFKHEKEMESLRQYFEQKCADVQKNFSDEVYSQHNHKKRSNSTSSEEDLPFDNRPGPGGDAPSSLENKSNLKFQLTKSKIIDLVNELKLLHDYFTARNHNFDQIRPDEFEDLKCKFSDFATKLLKGFRRNVRDLSEKDNEKIDLIRKECEEKIKEIRAEYDEEIEALKRALNASNKSILQSSSCVQEVSSGEFEITEVVQSYERRLQEQISLAKLDIITDLGKQIQRLASGNADDEEWPNELLALREKLREPYEKKIEKIKAEHETEINNLKEQLSRQKSFNARRLSKEIDHADGNLLDERNSYKKQAELLRKILGELMKYFTQCEDEVNNTIVDTLVRQGMEKNLTDIERELNDSTSSSKSELTNSLGKRVHIAPNIKELLTIIENSAEKPTELSDFRNELDICLDNLKAEANEILELSVNFSQKNPDNVLRDTTINSLTRRLIDEVRMKQEYKDQANEMRNVIDSLENERLVLERQVTELVEKSNITQEELEKARVKIAQLVEDGRREIVSEGFGGESTVLGSPSEGDQAIATFNELQERVRWMISKAPSSDQELFHLLEDLVKIGEKIIDEWKMEKQDLEQQVEVADKKYRQTCRFLEEQAQDRELERDESQRQIEQLQSQLRDNKRDRDQFAAISEEVDHLENQLKEAVKNLNARETKFKEIETEKNEAVEKIFFLRDVIRDLETQIKQKTETELGLRTLISDLECMIPVDQSPLDSPSRNVNASDAQKVREHIAKLESEVQRLRLGQELVGSEGPLKELKLQLIDIENILEKRTKELEDIHTAVSSTACSSPSEDMSIREVVRPKTPNTANTECEVPLQQLARLKEKLIRHSRVEDAAMKRIRDLEMQVFAQKSSIDEHQTEKEILKKEIADQLVLISSLQIRLDEQRIRAEHIEKQTNTSLEFRIYDLQKEVTELQERLQQRNKTINQLEAIVKETKSKLEEKQSEVDDEIIISLQKEIDHLRNQNELLRKRLNNGVDIIPNLVENIISDKNSDIESLRKQLSQAEKKLELYDSLGLDKSQISAIRNIKNCGSTLVEVASFLEMSSPDKPRRNIETSASLPDFFHHRPLKNDTTFLGSLNEIKEISSIDRMSSLKSSTPSVSKSEKRVHFETNDADNSNVKEKDEIIKNLNKRLETLKGIESNVDTIQKQLEETQDLLKITTEKFENELKEKDEKERNFKIDLMEKELHLEQKQQEIDSLKEDGLRKDNMYMEMMKEQKQLKKLLDDHENQLRQYLEIEVILNAKNKMIIELEEQISKLRDDEVHKEKQLSLLEEKEEETESLKLKLDILTKENDHKNDVINNLETENEKLKNEVVEERDNADKLYKELQNKKTKIEELNAQIISLEESQNNLQKETHSINNLKEQIKSLVQEKEEMEKTIINQNSTINKFNSENENASESISQLEKELNQLRKHIKDLGLEIISKNEELISLKNYSRNLEKEMEHFQELLVEKEKIIRQFKDDSNRLQSSLKTIQNKMQETGNVVDLATRLREEQIKNGELTEQLALLKAKMFGRDPMVESIEVDEITGKVQEELDYSAKLDSNILEAVQEESEKEDDRIEQLEAECRLLRSELERKTYELSQCRLEDGNLIEKLRIELEAATENEKEAEEVIEELKSRYQILEIECTKLRTKLQSYAASKSESTQYKELPPKDDPELMQLRLETQTLREDIVKLRNDLKSTKKSKKEADANNKYLVDELALRKREFDRLQAKLESNAKNEALLMDKLVKYNQKFQDKEAEIHRIQNFMGEIKNERDQLKKDISLLKESLKQKNQQGDLPEILPVEDQLLDKIQEISTIFRNDKRTMEYIIKITNENKNLKTKVFQLESEGINTAPFESPMNRANYLFAKCLRVESYRKALIFQKRYLISLLGSYGNVANVADGFVNRRRAQFSGVKKFRSAVYAVIIILRMKYLVRRWHSGTRIAENVNARYERVEGSSNQRPVSSARTFHLGQPVSSRQFESNAANVFRSNQRHSANLFENNAETAEMPMFSASPPCREKSVFRQRSNSNIDLLRAPHLLGQYAERCNRLQENLGSILNSIDN